MHPLHPSTLHSTPQNPHAPLTMASVPIDILRAFHKMERELFIRLVFEMRREPIQCMEIIALWLWLEEIGFPSIIFKLPALTDRVVDMVIEEAEACLKFLRPDSVPPTAKDNIPISTSFTGQSLSLKFLHENRDDATLGVSSTLTNVCLRIFDDILQSGPPTIFRPTDIRPPSWPGVNMGQFMFPTIGKYRPFEEGENVSRVPPFPGHLYGPHGEGPSRWSNPLDDSMIGAGGFEQFFRPPLVDLPPSVYLGCPYLFMDSENVTSQPPQGYGPSNVPPPFPSSLDLFGCEIPESILRSNVPPPPLPPSLNTSGDEFPDSILRCNVPPPFPSVLDTYGCEIPELILSGMGGMNISESPPLNPSVGPWPLEDEASCDGRTMFLTFSRGYPLNEDEIRDYFKRRWGDCIESLEMQETSPGIQPLFARLVLQSQAAVPWILAGRKKAKFVIKGKHVWARPYIPKKKRAPSQQ